MKYLTDYTNELKNDIYEKHNAFFAFNEEQFKEGIKPGRKYVHLGAGLYCWKNTYKVFISDFDNMIETARANDVKENGIPAIIERELNNHECFYTGNIEEVVAKLKPYGVTENQIIEKYRELKTTFSF